MIITTLVYLVPTLVALWLDGATTCTELAASECGKPETGLWRAVLKIFAQSDHLFSVINNNIQQELKLLPSLLTYKPWLPSLYQRSSRMKVGAWGWAIFELADCVADSETHQFDSVSDKDIVDRGIISTLVRQMLIRENERIKINDHFDAPNQLLIYGFQVNLLKK